MSDQEKRPQEEQEDAIPQSARARVMHSLGQDTENAPAIEVEPVGFWENFWYHHKWKVILIAVFGFMGILLKARDQDESRWLASSLSGFARPLDVAWLMALMNILVMLVMLACAVPLAGASVLLISHLVYEINSAAGIAALVLSVGLSALCSVPLIYAYRQAWFIKNEDPSLSACECLRRSRRLMKGHKTSAFLLDLSYAGWIFLVLLLLGAQALFAVGKSFGAMSAAISFAVSFLAFYALLKVMFSMLLSRAVFYRELQQSAVENTADA
jgi:hypothetical protein